MQIKFLETMIFPIVDVTSKAIEAILAEITNFSFATKGANLVSI